MGNGAPLKVLGHTQKEHLGNAFTAGDPEEKIEGSRKQNVWRHLVNLFS